LRNNQTPEEKLLWKLLRRRSFNGYKFLRQHPVIYREDKGWVDFFIADFYCNKLKMIIELDGKIHETWKEYDKERDDKLNSKGILVIRIKNEMTENLSNLEVFLAGLIKERMTQVAE
jgi:very-short-patch-repair endonuclease